MRQKKKQTPYLYLFISLLGLFIIGLLFGWIINTQPVDSNNVTKKTFVISPGTGVRTISQQLYTQGLIRNDFIFLLVVKKLGIEGSIQAGTYSLSPSMNAEEIAKTLTVGKNDIRVTIPEGKRAEEVAEIIVEKIPSIHFEEVKIKLVAYEGYLFPDTYYFNNATTLDTIVKTLTSHFDSKFATLSPSTTNVTKEKLVTIASLIEREARHAEDRPLIASVIYNRLSIGMKLDIDATVQYALGYNFYQKTWWKKGLTNADLQVDSPYNTYTNPGLPPGPIANPGLASLDAALNPAETDYLFYIADKQGVNRYARTLDEHNENIQRYGL